MKVQAKRNWLVPALWLPASICTVWTVIAGKDVNWDLLNYHYYLPYELLGGRLTQDFFAASAQSYLNPIGYLPFYWMVSAGWHSVAVSVVLALLHGSSLTLLFVLGRKLFSHLEPGKQGLFAAFGTGLGAATWVFWPMVGSSFIDPLLVPLILAGLLLLLETTPRRVALAGALFGAAAALKYSNAIYVLAALPLALAAGGPRWRARLSAGLAFAAGAALAVTVLAGPWLSLLAREFGNPVFPLMNAWFKSTDWPAVNLVNARFSPRGFADALVLPFRMAALDRHLYSETFAPDARLAALLLAAIALPAARLRYALPPERALQSSDWRLVAFFATGWVFWVASSANGRYGLVLLLLAGLILARLVERLLPGRAAGVLLAVLLAVQLATSLVASPTRWYNAEPWSRRWLPYEAPVRALHEPALYLSVEILPMAVVAPFLDPASAFVNFRGQHSLPSDAPRLAALLERYRGHVRVLGRRLELVDGSPQPAAVGAYNAALRQLGYRVDTRDCFTIAWRPEQDPLSRVVNRIALTLPSAEPLSVVSCGLRSAPRDPADIEAERRMSAVFTRIEHRCALLRRQTAVTESFGSGWLRHYNGLDARLEALGGQVVLEHFDSGEVFDLGRVSDWQSDDAPLPAACAARL